MNVRAYLVTTLLAAFLITTAEAKDTELSLKWQELPPSLVGQKVTVRQIDNTTVAGILMQIGPDSLSLQSKTKDLIVPRAKVQRLETKPQLHRIRGRVLGTALGAGVGIVAVSIAATYKHNENGSNSKAIVGGSVGLAAATTFLGYLMGRGLMRSHGDHFW